MLEPLLDRVGVDMGKPEHEHGEEEAGKYLAGVDARRLRQGGDKRGDQDLAIDRSRDIGAAFCPGRAHRASVSPQRR